MKPYLYHQRSGFTLIELLVVMVIITILATAILMDYGIATKKARLQVSAEEVMAMLEDAQVRAQTGYGVDVEMDEISGDVTAIQNYCWGVSVEADAEGGTEPPVLSKMPLVDGSCDTVTPAEEVQQLTWSDQVYVSAIYTQSGLNDPELTTDPVQIVFIPPRGGIEVYKGGTLMSGVSLVSIEVVHAHSDPTQDDIYTKTIEIMPATANFDITQKNDQ